MRTLPEHIRAVVGFDQPDDQDHHFKHLTLTRAEWRNIVKALEFYARWEPEIEKYRRDPAPLAAGPELLNRNTAALASAYRPEVEKAIPLLRELAARVLGQLRALEEV